MANQYPVTVLVPPVLIGQPQQRCFSGAASPVLATAISNYNTAAATIVAAQAGTSTANPTNPPTGFTYPGASAPISMSPPQIVFDGTNYVILGCINYTVYL